MTTVGFLGQLTQQPLTARLHPKWVGGRDGYRYSVICRGELLVDRSRDPECDAARALLAIGQTGELTMLDGKTGVPRTIINIEKTAKLAVEETGGAPRLRKYRERGGSEAPSPEAPPQVGEVA
jgi:hypothetical protein